MTGHKVTLDQMFGGDPLGFKAERARRTRSNTGGRAMYTREDMFRDNAADGPGAHSRYYGEIVRECGIKPSDEVLKYATREKLAADRHMNNVRNLQWWDACALGISRLPYVHKALRERGDYMTQGNALCLLKEAVRIHYGEGRKV